MIRKKIILLFVLLFAFAGNGCVYHQKNALQMIDDMKKIQSSSKARINILWYKGSNQEFDYFGYVYSMTGRKRYKVPSTQLIIDRRIALTSDDTKWVRIKQIGELWSASRLNRGTGIWAPDREGVSIQISR